MTIRDQKKLRIRNINFINDNIDDLSTSKRIKILSMIMAEIDDEKIIEKNVGSEVLFKHLDDILLNDIANFIQLELNKGFFF